MELHGVATFPGINQFVSASFSFTHGISPSVCTFSIVPQAGYWPVDGTLSFSFGGERITFSDCRVDVGRITRNRSGETWQLSILDRRWKWRFGRINGLYNLRDSDGTIRGHDLPPEESTERTPQELAELCLKAMGESGYDIGELPNKARPEVRWNDVPAEALARLCDELGCRVVLRLDNTVKLCQAGYGGDLPTDGIMSGGASVNPPDGPRELAIECGGNRYQVDLELEAVGIDNDTDNEGRHIGTIVPTNDLGYKPASGWEIDVFSFDTGGNVLDDDDYELAKKSVYKMYRVVFPLTVEGFEDITNIDRVVIENEQIDTKVERSVKSNRPAAIRGVWASGGEDLTNSAADALYIRNWSLNAKTGIITFSDPVYKQRTSGAAGGVQPADLVLRTAMQIREPKTGALARYIRTQRRDTPADTLPRYYKHHELHLGLIGNAPTNQNEIDEACDHYLDAAEREYQTEYPQSIRYMGLRRVDLDGAIQQMSIDISANGTTTTLSRNTEELLRVRSYKAQRRVEDQREQNVHRKLAAEIAARVGQV